MKLNAKVIHTHSASQYADKLRRVTLKVEETDCLNTQLTVKSDELREDQSLTLLVLTEDARVTLMAALDAFDPARNFPRVYEWAQFLALRDSLRPGLSREGEEHA